MEKKLIHRMARDFIVAGTVLIGTFSGYLYYHENQTRAIDVDVVFDQFEAVWRRQEECRKKKWHMYETDYRHRGESIDFILTTQPEMKTPEHLQELCRYMDVESIMLLDSEGQILLSSDEEETGGALIENQAAKDIRAFLSEPEEDSLFTLDSYTVFDNRPAQDYVLVKSSIDNETAGIFIGIDDEAWEGIKEVMSVKTVMGSVVPMREQTLLIIDSDTREVLGGTNSDYFGEIVPERYMDTFRSAEKRKIGHFGKVRIFVKSREFANLLLVSVQRLKSGLHVTMEQILGSGAILITIFVILIFVIRRYFDDYIYKEFAMIENTISEIAMGEDGLRFHTAQKTEMRNMVKSLNQLASINEDLQLKVQDSDRDRLTGLINRRGFEKYISALMKEDRKRGVMIMFDIDNFKAVNDNMGHPEGDRVLQMTAKCLKTTFREEDMLVRLGGDEFVAFLKSDIPRERLEEKLKTVIYKFRNEFPEYYEKYHISISIGAAVIEAGLSDYKQLYKCADDALYEAKKEGKDRYVIHSFREEN